jgi:uncharacterized protein
MNMKSMSKQIENFPLFPIPLIVFPGEIQPLHIFEPRYKQLIADMQENKGGIFGVPYFVNGKICEFGSIVTLHKVLATSPTGEMDILVRGVNLFRIVDLRENLENKLYGGGTIELLNELNHKVSNQLIEQFRSYKKQLSNTDKEVSRDIQIVTPNNILDIAGQLPFEIDEKYKIIKSPNHLQREQFVMEKLKFLLMINKKVKEVGYKFYLN